MSIKKNIKATNIKLTQEISNYIDKRLESIERLIDADDTSAIFNIEIEKIQGHQTGDVFRAEIRLHIAGKDLYAESRQDTILNAIDKARDEALMELRKTKGKKRRLLMRGGYAIKAFINSIGSRGVRLRDFVKRRRR